MGQGGLSGASDIVNGGPTIIGNEADENKSILDGLIRKKMREKCSLNLVPGHKMAAMIDKYVSSNNSHSLEAFFDHEVFRKSYHEIVRTLIDVNQKKGAATLTDEFER